MGCVCGRGGRFVECVGGVGGMRVLRAIALDLFNNAKIVVSAIQIPLYH